MCGIVGCLDLTHELGEDELAREVITMRDQMVFRGPDDAGIWIDPAAGVAFGHRRLSIVDLSHAGHQPMVSHNEDWVLTYNGEIYNAEHIRPLLLERNWRGTSDSEVLLEAFVQWGIEPTLSKVDGMFAFALWNRSTRRLVLGRDRFGEKPLYYGRVGKRFVFASQPRSLEVATGFTGQLDQDAIAAYLRYGYVPSPRSVWAGISKLPPGHWLELDPVIGAAPRIHRYYDPVSEARSAMGTRPQVASLPRDERLDLVEHALRASVKRRLVSDVPLGAFLSGGVDSSLVVALMSDIDTKPVHTFTIGFEEAEYDESAWAQKVAKHLGTHHTELRVRPQDAIDVVADLPEMYDEPFADSSQIPTFLVSKLARKSVTVALSGDGGDELFGGYQRYALFEKHARRADRIPPAAARVAARGLGKISERGLSRIDRSFARLGERAPKGVGHKIGRLGQILDGGPESWYLPFVSLWMNPDSVMLSGREPATMPRTPSAWPGAPTRYEQAMLVDTLSYLPEDILTKVDRAGMAVSLESRIPMLEPTVFSTAWQLPDTDRVDATGGKVALRAVLKRHIPDELVDRPKMGFGVPIGEWMRKELRELTEAELSERALSRSEIFDAEVVRSVWENHRDGVVVATPMVWTVLMFQLWHDAARERIAAAARRRSEVLLDEHDLQGPINEH